MTMNIIDKTIPTAATRENVRLMIPVLVHWAKTGRKNCTYGDMNRATGKERFSGIGHALGAVHDVIEAVKKETGWEIPTLNSLCKNTKTMLPGDDFSYVIPEYKGLEEKSKRILVEGLDSKAIEYQEWDRVLAYLELKPSVLFDENDIETIKHPRLGGFGGGEGEEHKSIKEQICAYPEVIGYKNVVVSETEHILPSGDRLDVYLELRDGTHVAIEVKPNSSPDDDICRGIFQCVKYEAVMKALRRIESGDYKIDVLLVSAKELSKKNKVLAEELNVKTKRYK